MAFPNRPVRRAQLISPFGIGAMVNFPGDESLMPVVIDEWPEGMKDCPSDSGWKIRDERLEARLGVTHFRFPPDFRDADGDNKHFAYQRVPMARFPRWHYCHLCGGMEYVNLHESKPPRCKGFAFTDGRSCQGLPEKRRPKLMPVRFVAVCELGHIEDFPFMEWAHNNDGHWGGIKGACQLRFRAGVSAASLAGVVIECVTCKLKRSMVNAFEFKRGQGGPLARMDPALHCQGGAPWTGVALPKWRDGTATGASCGQLLRVVQRGGSNVYLPRVVSSLYLQGWAKMVDPVIIELLEDAELWEHLSGTVDGEIPLADCQALVRFRKLTGKVDPVALRDAAQAKLTKRPAGNQPLPKAMTEAEYRAAEYKALCEDEGDMKTDFYVVHKRRDDYEADVSKFFSRIHLVPKLRETRALEGFSRLNPTEGGISANMRPVRNNPKLDWLPATMVFGEGIFLELNSTELADWEKRYDDGRPEHRKLFEQLNQRRTSQGLSQRELSPTFLLLHALTHALINQLSFDCGYGSASLRERLFFQRNSGKPPMHGLLIYTASGDSEGSMGGLVRQGQPGRLEPTIRRAIEKATWCSNDPVCLESTGQGADNCNLAACHGCLLLPETSCEEGNRLLDRAALVGSHANPEFGYFSSLI
ncbi:DrmB family protein [Prosthecobacter sp.]|uniref:DrmB family protein n=1 Tax=Prosthecobacter sp. TaxID=1965333 RepID=UPI00378355A4